MIGIDVPTRVREWLRRCWYFLHRDAVTRDLEEEMRIHVEFRAESLRKLAIGEHIAHASAESDIHDNINHNINHSINQHINQHINHNDNHDINDININSNSNNSETKIDHDTLSRARRRFGNTTTIQQRSRDMWGFARLDELTHDLQFSLRRLVKRPGFTLSVVGVMAIGIGATTAMFSAVDAALLRPLPFRNPGQLVTLPILRVPFDPGANNQQPVHFYDMTDARAMTDVLTSIAAYAAGGLNLSDPETPIRLKAGVVTSNFFNTLGVSAFRGRTFVDHEGVPGGADVVVLSYGLWQRQYGSRDVVGLHIIMNSKSYEVVGVMPPRFNFPSESDLWIPMTIPTTFETFSAFRGFLPTTVIGRMAPAMTAPVTSARLITVVKQAREAIKDSKRHGIDEMIANAQKDGAALPLQRQLVGDRTSALLMLLGATGLLLLIACVNVTNLLLSQAAERRRELTLRQVLGATRARIVRQLLTESIVLSMSGALVGLLVAPFALSLMRALIPKSLAGVSPASLDWRVLAFATVLALVTGVAFGMWPAIGSSRQSDSDVIKSGSGHGSTAAHSGRARRALVSAELALTVMLLIGAGLMLRSFDALMSKDSGMRPSQVATLEMAFPSKRDGRAERLRRVDEILTRLTSMPGIESAGAINDLPLNGVGGIGLNISVQGIPEPKGQDMRFARYLMATGGYFKTMGIKLQKGRLFTAADDSLAPKVAVISATMAKVYWPNIDPIGRTFSFGGRPGGNDPQITVVGVVADVLESKLEQDPEPQMYLSFYAEAPTTVAIIARGEIAEKTLLSHLQDAVRGADKSQAVFNVRMMSEVVSVSVAPRRTNTVLIAAFAGLALLLASVGVYAVVAHGVSYRTRELGIRSALGANGFDLVRMISQEMVWVAAIGVVVGIGGAWALAKTFSSLVYGVDVHDPITFALVPIALLIPTILATLLPARRAGRVNPAEVMRAD